MRVIKIIYFYSEENIDMSPANTFLMTARPGFSSNTSLNTMDSNMPTPSELEPLHEFGAIPTEVSYIQFNEEIIAYR